MNILNLISIIFCVAAVVMAVIYKNTFAAGGWAAAAYWTFINHRQQQDNLKNKPKQ